mmetsp:Transcript_40384/g.99157  ORF Transcript_40384/g.99157 Transcript_40384/m.99157 type:complete len:222 (-) Transcript_40384:2460-3125(-)
MAGDDGDGRRSALFPQTQRFTEAVRLLNACTSPKLPLVVAKVLAGATAHTPPFSDDERERLVAVLGVSGAADVDLLLSVCQFVFEQAANYAIGDDVLLSQLQRGGVNEQHARVFAEAWKSGGAKMRAALVEQSLAPARLERVDWRLHLQLAQKASTRINEPVALVNFELGVDAPGAASNVSTVSVTPTGTAASGSGGGGGGSPSSPTPPSLTADDRRKLSK